MQQTLGLEEYILRRRKERDERKEVMESIKPDVDLLPKNKPSPNFRRSAELERSEIIKKPVEDKEMDECMLKHIIFLFLYFYTKKVILQSRLRKLNLLLNLFSLSLPKSP